jgi:hypothetical protein
MNQELSNLQLALWVLLVMCVLIVLYLMAVGLEGMLP